LNEGEIKEINCKIVQKQKITTKDQAIKQPVPISHTLTSFKQKLSQKDNKGDINGDFKHNEGDIDGEPANKKTCLGLDKRPQPNYIEI
jgi:hypothetical protein